MKVALLVEVDTSEGGEDYEERLEDAFMSVDLEAGIADVLGQTAGYLIEDDEVTIHDVRRADRYRSLQGLP